MTSHLIFLSVLFLLAQEPTSDQIKLDLVGKTMGGREKGWKFQSADQIKEMNIQDRKEEGDKRVYTLSLTLQDARVPGPYAAEAEATYEKVGSQWKLEVVGLKSMKKLEP
jgi:hypothetical protein